MKEAQRWRHLATSPFHSLEERLVFWHREGTQAAARRLADLAQRSAVMLNYFPLQIIVNTVEKAARFGERLWEAKRYLGCCSALQGAGRERQQRLPR